MARARCYEASPAPHHLDQAMTYSPDDLAIMRGCLPCPFCGADPIVEPSDAEIAEGRAGKGYGFVRCVNPRCPAQPRVTDGATTGDWGSHAHRKAAVARWNTRA